MIKNNKGQTLVILLVFVALAITVALAAVAVIVSNTASASKFELGAVTAQAAESGTEVALIKLLRDPNYTGESFTIDTASVTVNVVGGDTKTVTSTASMGDFIRKVQTIVNFSSDGKMTITSWKEAY